MPNPYQLLGTAVLVLALLAALLFYRGEAHDAQATLTATEKVLRDERRTNEANEKALIEARAEAQRQAGAVAAIATERDQIAAQLQTIKDTPTDDHPEAKADSAAVAGRAFDLLADELRATRSGAAPRLPAGRPPN